MIVNYFIYFYLNSRTTSHCASMWPRSSESISFTNVSICTSLNSLKQFMEWLDLRLFPSWHTKHRMFCSLQRSRKKYREVGKSPVVSFRVLSRIMDEEERIGPFLFICQIFIHFYRLSRNFLKHELPLFPRGYPRFVTGGRHSRSLFIMAI